MLMRNLRSSEIRFDRNSESYILAARPTLTFKRCSEFVGSFFEEFDRKKVAERLVSTNSNYRGRTAVSLQREWDSARRDGTQVHEDIANSIGNSNAPTLSKSRIAMQWLQQSYPDYVREAEVIVYDEQLALAGTIDLLLRRKASNRCILIDWKTNRSIAMKAYNDKRGIKGPARSWADCDHVKYSLQLSLYRFILEAHYGFSVDEQFLIHLTDSSAKTIPCVYMKREVAQMLISARLTSSMP